MMGGFLLVETNGFLVEEANVFFVEETCIFFVKYPEEPELLFILRLLYIFLLLLLLGSLDIVNSEFSLSM